MGRSDNCLRTLPLFVLLFFALACGGGGGGEGGDPPDPAADTGTPSRVLSVTTYNLGLLPFFVPLANQRVLPAAEALAQHEADVLCLQEIWRPADVRTVSEVISERYPFIYLEPPRQKFASSLPVCSVSDLAPLGVCVSERCLFSGGGFVECLQNECFQPVSGLAESKPECAQALFAQAGRPVSDLRSIREELFSDTRPAGLFAFDGSNGLMLASRFPLQRRQLLDFFDVTTTIRRAALFATIELDGEHYVGCTHLASNLDGLLPYTGTLGSWEGEGRAQADLMISFAERYSRGGARYLAGDFNCSIGNASTGVESDSPENCSRFLSAGYRDPAAEQLGCSFCSQNLLVAGSSDFAAGRDLLLDHIFTRNLPSGVLAEIVFDAPRDIGGRSAHLSDHFGIRIR